MNGNPMESPAKQIRTMGSNFHGDAKSPMIPWTTSPFAFDCFSPESSNISFTMSSPPPYGASAQTSDQAELHGKGPTHQLMSSFSPSIFSPGEKVSRLPKKRGHDSFGDEKVSPDSRPASRSSIDLPTALSLLDSPHMNLWSGTASGFPSMLGSNGRLFSASGIASENSYTQESGQTTSVDESIQKEFAIPMSIKLKMKAAVSPPDGVATEPTTSSSSNWSNPELSNQKPPSDSLEEVRGYGQKITNKVSPIAASKTSAVEATMCNCKKSKCLKLYCDCFAVLNYCGVNCNCYDCCNRSEREATRQEAIRSTRERNANAFQTKINDKEQHSTGCHCKNSQCLKKYCECFTASAFCGNNCKCLTCLNFSGSVELVKARNNCKDFNDAGVNNRKRKDSPSAAHPMRSLSSTTPTDQAKKGSTIAVTPLEGPGTKLLTPDLMMRSATQPNLLTSRMVGGLGNLAAQGRMMFPPPTMPLAPITPDAGGSAKRMKVGSANHSQSDSGLSGGDSSLKQLRNRKVSQPSTGQTSTTSMPMKKRQVKFAPIVYPFFGETLPPTSKITALKCLDYLEGKDIYAMSQVNKIWSQAAMDDALWE